MLVNVLYYSKITSSSNSETSRTSSNSNRSVPSHVRTYSQRDKKLLRNKKGPDLRDSFNRNLWSSKRGHQEEKRAKNDKEKILHHAITEIKLEDIQNVIPKGETAASQKRHLNRQEEEQGREEIIALLMDAGVDRIETEVLAHLPRWKDILELYGDGPVVYGLETCQRFRDEFPPHDASIGTSGLFNTGTDPFAMYIQNNCYLKDNKTDRYKGMRWQVPWGKHVAPFLRNNNTAHGDTRVNKTNVMPVTLIRDPFSWMASMCKHRYGENLIWPNTKHHCPNLLANEEDVKTHPNLKLGDQINVLAKYSSQHVQWPTLLDMYNDWYLQYFEADYPRLMIRFEDMIFHPREVVSIVCDCAGALPKTDTFTYVVDAGKWGGPHKGSSNLVSAMIKYGSAPHRLKGLTEDEIEYARKILSPELMEVFQYKMP